MTASLREKSLALSVESVSHSAEFAPTGFILERAEFFAEYIRSGKLIEPIPAPEQPTP